jgi:hypothetical protein
MEKSFSVKEDERASRKIKKLQVSTTPLLEYLQTQNDDFSIGYYNGIVKALTLLDKTTRFKEKERAPKASTQQRLSK